MIPLPKGFLSSGVNCGVRENRPDLGLIFTRKPMTASAVFTLNQCQAAPVLYSRKLVPSENIRAVITNSGQANAATGVLGEIDNQRMAEALAEHLGVSPDQILTASTGVIGRALQIDLIEQSLDPLIARATADGGAFAAAILTTDLVPKSASASVRLSQGSVQITGICKGSGMIHPNMATMLGYLLTDAKLTASQAERLVKQAVDDSFNMISVDGDCSTNDCVFLLASHESGVALENQSDQQLFAEALLAVAQELAKKIAADGEGATKLIEVRLTGAPSRELARRAARSVIVSPLVKTAMHGSDPNWGRILARLGAEQVPARALEQMHLKIQGHELFAAGRPTAFDKKVVHEALRQAQVLIEIDLKVGDHRATAWGCDLSSGYVSINTEYTT